MNKENKITLNNLGYAILFLILGLMLLTSTEDIISIVSKILGIILVIIGLVKLVKYIYMKGKLGNYSSKELFAGLIIFLGGVAFITLSGTFGFVIRLMVGAWSLFTGINRMIFAFSTKKIDIVGFRVYLITSIFMLLLGVLIITGIFDQVIGLLVVLYSVAEIINYIYFKIKNKDYEPVQKSKKNINEQKKLKNNKVVDAVIEETEKE